MRLQGVMLRYTYVVSIIILYSNVKLSAKRNESVSAREFSNAFKHNVRYVLYSVITKFIHRHTQYYIVLYMRHAKGSQNFL